MLTHIMLKQKADIEEITELECEWGAVRERRGSSESQFDCTMQPRRALSLPRMYYQADNPEVGGEGVDSSSRENLEPEKVHRNTLKSWFAI